MLYSPNRPSDQCRVEIARVLVEGEKHGGRLRNRQISSDPIEVDHTDFDLRNVLLDLRSDSFCEWNGYLLIVRISHDDHSNHSRTTSIVPIRPG